MPVGSTPCLGAPGYPLCGGFCPPGEGCLGVNVPGFFTGCFCVPPDCAIGPPYPPEPACGAGCPSGKSCETVVFPNAGIGCLCLP